MNSECQALGGASFSMLLLPEFLVPVAFLWYSTTECVSARATISQDPSDLLALFAFSDR